MSGYTITSERIDDVPLVMAWLTKMQVAALVDINLPKPHGNRQGVSYGQLTVLYLTYLLTECNHFLSPVQDWAEQRKQCLSQLLGAPLRPTDCTDDRLQDLLDVLGEQASAREKIEIEMGQHLIRAYSLPTKTGRIDTTTVSVYHQPDDQSLLTFGHSKDHRPDLRQFKEALGTLDPVGIPLCSVTLKGACADDPVYVPVWRRMVKILGHTDFLCVGDCKMASLETRATLQKEGGCYLAPLPMTGETPTLLKQLLKRSGHNALGESDRVANAPISLPVNCSPIDWSAGNSTAIDWSAGNSTAIDWSAGNSTAIDTRSAIKRDRDVADPVAGLACDERNSACWANAQPEDTCSAIKQGAGTPEEIVLFAGTPEQVRVGVGFEESLERTYTDPTTKEHFPWSERTLVMCSDKLRKRHQEQLSQRLQQAQEALLKLLGHGRGSPINRVGALT